jgi:hypothetical protein
MMNDVNDYTDEDIASLEQDELYDGSLEHRVNDSLKAIDFLIDAVGSQAKSIDAQAKLNNRLIGGINTLANRVTLLENIVADNLPEITFH